MLTVLAKTELEYYPKIIVYHSFVKPHMHTYTYTLIYVCFQSKKEGVLLSRGW